MKPLEDGYEADRVLRQIHAMQSRDGAWRDGKLWAYTYLSDDELYHMSQEAYLSGFSSNGLSPRAFPSLARMEGDVVQALGALFHGSDVRGSLTSGGSESIFLAVKSARDWAREERGITQPEMVLAYSAHPAFNKAAHYLGVRAIRTETEVGGLASVDAMKRAISEQTIMLVASAPSYPHGVIDPVAGVAALAAVHGLRCHVDACVGGLMVPFAKMLGRSVPEFDFGVDGVTSMSADLHKYGYTPKGVSAILHRDAEGFDFQGFAFDEWPGGDYTVPNLSGTRPGGAITAAWAVLCFLGVPGYLELTRRALEAADRLRDGILSCPELFIVGQPSLTLLAFGSHKVDIAGVGSHLTRKGWVLSLQRDPVSLHLTVSAGHGPVVPLFLKDLRDALSQADVNPGGTERMEGGYN